MKKLFFVLFMLIAVFAYGQQNANPSKYALVIGNQDYTKFGKLTKTRTDANDMETALRSIGFTVDKVLDGNLEQMQNALTRLRKRLEESKDSYGFFYYSGHGAQNRRGDENYLIPADADIPSENYVGQRALSLQTVHAEMSSAGNELNIIVLDACRDFPAVWSKSASSKGLSPVTYRLVKSLIVYATTPGEVAVEDSTGRNSLYTEHLLKYLTNPDLHVNEMFRRVNEDVVKASKEEQIPQVNGQYFGTAVLNPTGVRPVNPRPAPVVQPVAPPVNPPPANMVRINGGTFTMGSPASEPSRGSDETQHQVTVSAFYMGKYEVTQKEWYDVMGTNPSYFKGDNLPVEGVSWYDAIEYCNARSRKEGLTPAYTIDKSRSDPNNRSEYDDVRWVVTWNRNANGYRLPAEAEWEYACRAGTRTPFNTGNNITTSQANYGMIGKATHELTRPGLVATHDTYPFGQKVTVVNAENGKEVEVTIVGRSRSIRTDRIIDLSADAWNALGLTEDNQVRLYLASFGPEGTYRQKTTTVGNFESNPWGLYDMHGNVAEWCWDWYGNYTAGAQTDPQGASSGSYRVHRGGDCGDPAEFVRSADRHYNYPDNRNYGFGFRLARNAN